MTDGLTGETRRLTLPTDYERPSLLAQRPAHEAILLDAPLIRRIRETAAPGAVIVAAFQALLYRLTGQEAFTVSVYVSELPVRENPTVPGEDAGSVAVACRTNGTEQFRALISAAEGALRVSAQPAFTTDLADIDLPLAVDAGDLLLHITPAAGSAAIRVHYDASVFEAVTIRRWLQGFRDLLTAGVTAPDREVGTLPSVGGGAARPGGAVAVHRLIERHAVAAPTHEALVFGDEVIHYGALDQKAAAVAQALEARGLGRGARVAVYLSRSADLVTSLLAIMKVGAVSVPLDPADPPARVTAILEDSGAALVVTDSARRRQLPPTELPILFVDQVENGARGPAAGSSSVSSGPDSLEATACLFYACEACQLVPVPLSHGTLAALLASVRTELSLTHEDVALAIARPSLDVSVIELLAPLSASGCVVIAADDVAFDSERLIEAVGRSATTVMVAPTTVWADLLAVAGAAWPRLKAVCFGAVPPRGFYTELVARTSAAWFAAGSISAAVWTTLHRMTEKDSADLLGKPLGHVSLRIVDADGCEVPTGVVGELLVRLEYGPQTDTTPEWARTGQQARCRVSGDVELVAEHSRHAFVDGFRVDLDDVARAIRRHAAVLDAEVMFETGATADRLVACVVPRAGAAYSVSELRRELRRTVPAALVPQSFVAVGAIPRAADGRAEFRPLSTAPGSGRQKSSDRGICLAARANTGRISG